MTFIYRKIGRRSPSEQRMETDLHEFFEANPDKLPKDIVTTAQELKSLHDKYVFDSIEVVETEMKQQRDAPSRDFSESLTRDVSDDPLNRQQPKVRGYVLDNNTADSTQTTFDEPVSFDEAFAIPDPTDDTIAFGPQKSEPTSEKKPRTEFKEKEGPIFNEDSSESTAKLKKKTKRFAVAIVKITCDLTEFGIIWFATKDITDERLEELQAETGVDLSLLLEMDQGQKITVREFLVQTRLSIIANAKVEKEEREELADALYEVLLEKGVQPTTGQNLILVAAGIFIPKGLNGFTSYKIASAVIAQIKALAVENVKNKMQDQEEFNAQEVYAQQEVEFPSTDVQTDEIE